MKLVGYSNHLKKTLKLAIPVCLGQLGHVMVGVIDSIMVGNYGDPTSNIGTLSLAASSLANSLFSVVLVFGIGLSYGITPLVANADGENDTEKITLFLRHGVFISLMVSLFLFAILFLSSSLLSLLDQPIDVVDLAIPYFNILVFSLIPLMFFLFLKQFAEGLSYTKQATYLSLLANVANIGLNYLFIYGKFGFPEMGLEGAGWATFASRVIMAVAMLYYLSKSAFFRKYAEGLRLKRISQFYIKKILALGIPVGFQLVFEVGAFAFAAIMMGWLGKDELAAHQIAISIATITYMAASGISSAATVMVGNAIGKNRRLELRKAGFSAFIIGIGFMSLCAILFILFRNQLPLLFTSSNKVVEIAAYLLIVAAIFQVSDGVQVIGLGALRGMSDVKIPTVVTVMAYWLIGLPVAYLLGFNLAFGAIGIWIGLLVGLTIAASLHLLRFNALSKS